MNWRYLSRLWKIPIFCSHYAILLVFFQVTLRDLTDTVTHFYLSSGAMLKLFYYYGIILAISKRPSHWNVALVTMIAVSTTFISWEKNDIISCLLCPNIFFAGIFWAKIVHRFECSVCVSSAAWNVIWYSHNLYLCLLKTGNDMKFIFEIS